MASSKITLVALAFLGIAMTKTMATDYNVGDGSGWGLGIDYQAWASGKQFRVGDKLIFKYPAGAHNVILVNQNGFQSCHAAPGDVTLESGNDVVELKARGTQFFICGVGPHCTIGPQKFSINVA